VIVFRYLGKELFSNLMAITIVLLIIFITDQFIHYLNDAAKGQITMTAVMQIMSLQIPLLLGYLLPLGLYLSILIAYGRLYVDHEMTVLSSCGMSRLQLLGMTSVIAVLVMMVVAVLMLWAEPIVQGYRTSILDKAVTNASIQKVVPKRFQVFDHDGVFYVDRLSRQHDMMYNVLLAKPLTTKNGWDITLSQAAKEQDKADGLGKFVIFQEGARYIGTVGQRNFKSVKFKDYGVRLVTSNHHLNDWPNNVATKDLFHLIKTEEIPKKRRKLEAMLQWRMAMPISVLLFALLAIPLSVVKPRSGKFARLVPAILIYVVYADLMFLGRSWIERGAISPSLGLWWIHGAALLLGIILNIHSVGGIKRLKQAIC
jgi:lipopolysaccharide export system permease protein